MKWGMRGAYPLMKFKEDAHMKFTTNFTRIEYDTQLAIEYEIAHSLNAVPILICKYSNHPDDDYLYLYIAQSKADEYIAINFKSNFTATSIQGWISFF